MVAFRFEPDYTVDGRHYAHPLVSWSAVIAGAVIAIAVGFVLNLVGLAIGAAAFNPFNFEGQEDTLSVAGGLYVIFAQFVAFQIGAYVASRSAQYPDHFGGAVTGGLVWALAVVVAVVLATLAASGATGTEAVMAQVADTAGDIQANVDTADMVEAEAGADAAAMLAWWGAAALLLGAAGGIAGGWLGAHHPAWETRPRHVHTMTR